MAGFDHVRVVHNYSPNTNIVNVQTVCLGAGAHFFTHVVPGLCPAGKRIDHGLLGNIMMMNTCWYGLSGFILGLPVFLATLGG